MGAGLEIRGAAGGIGATAEHLHFIGHDLGGVAILTVLILPFTRLDLALEIGLGAFLEVLGSDLGQLAEHDDAVPFRAFLHFAGILVLPGFVGGDIDVDDRAAARGVLDFRIASEGSDDDCFVYASGHGDSSGFGAEITGSLPE